MHLEWPVPGLHTRAPIVMLMLLLCALLLRVTCYSCSCVPSSSCCCAVGPLSITPVTTSAMIPALPAALAGYSGASSAPTGNLSSLIVFTTGLDGGSACVGMSNVRALPFQTLVL